MGVPQTWRSVFALLFVLATVAANGGQLLNPNVFLRMCEVTVDLNSMLWGTPGSCLLLAIGEYVQSDGSVPAHLYDAVLNNAAKRLADALLPALHLALSVQSPVLLLALDGARTGQLLHKRRWLFRSAHRGGRFQRRLLCISKGMYKARVRGRGIFICKNDGAGVSRVLTEQRSPLLAELVRRAAAILQKAPANMSDVASSSSTTTRVQVIAVTGTEADILFANASVRVVDDNNRLVYQRPENGDVALLTFDGDAMLQVATRPGGHYVVRPAAHGGWKWAPTAEATAIALGQVHSKLSGVPQFSMAPISRSQRLAAICLFASPGSSDYGLLLSPLMTFARWCKELKDMLSKNPRKFVQFTDFEWFKPDITAAKHDITAAKHDCLYAAKHDCLYAACSRLCVAVPNLELRGHLLDTVIEYLAVDKHDIKAHQWISEARSLVLPVCAIAANANAANDLAQLLAQPVRVPHPPSDGICRYKIVLEFYTPRETDSSEEEEGASKSSESSSSSSHSRRRKNKPGAQPKIHVKRQHRSANTKGRKSTPGSTRRSRSKARKSKPSKTRRLGTKGTRGLTGVAGRSVKKQEYVARPLVPLPRVVRENAAVRERLDVLSKISTAAVTVFDLAMLLLSYSRTTTTMKIDRKSAATLVLAAAMGKSADNILGMCNISAEFKDSVQALVALAQEEILAPIQGTRLESCFYTVLILPAIESRVTSPDVVSRSQLLNALRTYVWRRADIKNAAVPLLAFSGDVEAAISELTLKPVKRPREETEEERLFAEFTEDHVARVLRQGQAALVRQARAGWTNEASEVLRDLHRLLKEHGVALEASQSAWHNWQTYLSTMSLAVKSSQERYLPPHVSKRAQRERKKNKNEADEPKQPKNTTAQSTANTSIAATTSRATKRTKLESSEAQQSPKAKKKKKNTKKKKKKSSAVSSDEESSHSDAESSHSDAETTSAPAAKRARPSSSSSKSPVPTSTKSGAATSSKSPVPTESSSKSASAPSSSTKSRAATSTTKSAATASSTTKSPAPTVLDESSDEEDASAASVQQRTRSSAAKKSSSSKSRKSKSPKSAKSKSAPNTDKPDEEDTWQPPPEDTNPAPAGSPLRLQQLLGALVGDAYQRPLRHGGVAYHCRRSEWEKLHVGRYIVGIDEVPDFNMFWTVGDEVSSVTYVLGAGTVTHLRSPPRKKHVALTALHQVAGTKDKRKTARGEAEKLAVQRRVDQGKLPTEALKEVEEAAADPSKPRPPPKVEGRMPLPATRGLISIDTLRSLAAPTSGANFASGPAMTANSTSALSSSSSSSASAPSTSSSSSSSSTTTTIEVPTPGEPRFIMRRVVRDAELVQDLEGSLGWLAERTCPAGDLGDVRAISGTMNRIQNFSVTRKENVTRVELDCCMRKFGLSGANWARYKEAELAVPKVSMQGLQAGTCAAAANSKPFSQMTASERVAKIKEHLDADCARGTFQYALAQTRARQKEWQRHRQERQALGLVRRIDAFNGEAGDPLMIYGAAHGQHAGKVPAVKHRLLLQTLHGFFPCVAVREDYTSQRCVCCAKESAPGPSYRSKVCVGDCAKECARQNKKPRPFDRDVGASLNIWADFLCEFLAGARPVGFEIA